MVVFSESMFWEFWLFNSIISTFISNNDASSVQAFRLLRICLSKDLTPSSILCFLQSTDLIKGKDNSILLLPFGPCCWLFLCLFLSKFSHWCSSADSSRSSSPLVPPLSGSVTTCSGENSSWQKKKKILQYFFLSFCPFGQVIPKIWQLLLSTEQEKERPHSFSFTQFRFIAT